MEFEVRIYVSFHDCDRNTIMSIIRELFDMNECFQNVYAMI